MAELATAMPGCVSYKDYADDDGESVTLVEFASADMLLAWRNHSEHRAVQDQARDEFFADKRVAPARWQQVEAPLRAVAATVGLDGDKGVTKKP